MRDARQILRVLPKVKTYSGLVELARKACLWKNKNALKEKLMKCVMLGAAIFLMIEATLDRYSDTYSQWAVKVLSLDMHNRGVFYICAFIIGMVMVYFYEKRRSMIHRLGRQITLRSLELRYAISVVPSLPTDCETSKELDRPHEMPPEDQEEVTRGIYKGTCHELPYYFCRKKYVIKRELEYPTRSFLFVQFPWVKGISVRGDRHVKNDFPVKSITAHREFNECFTLTGRTEMDCVRFAKPTTLLHLIKFSQVLLKPNFLFAENGCLCIGFYNENCLLEEAGISLNQPLAFYRAIKRGAAMPFMEQVMQLVHELAEQHDDNFEAQE